MDKVTEILSMLRHQRPAFSECEEEFIKKYIFPLGGLMKDDYGNIVKKIGDKPEVMWSCHTDTVHKRGGMQSVSLMGNYAVLKKTAKKSNCLGADDAIGVWLMMEMIRAGKEGLYVFHRCEERGGQGSEYITKHHEDAFADIKCVIALDRAGTRDLITHQSWERCCSDEFGASLAKALNMKYELSTGGVFTDSANYTDIVGECTNLSVGYEDEHSKKEKTDVLFAHNLRDSLLALDYSKLVFKREPGDVDIEDSWATSWGKFRGGDSFGGTTMRELVWDHPDAVADMLEDYGVGVGELQDHIFNTTGEVPRGAGYKHEVAEETSY